MFPQESINHWRTSKRISRPLTNILTSSTRNGATSFLLLLPIKWILMNKGGGGGNWCYPTPSPPTIDPIHKDSSIMKTECLIHSDGN